MVGVLESAETAEIRTGVEDTAGDRKSLRRPGPAVTRRTSRRAYPAANSSSRIFEAEGIRLEWPFWYFDSMLDSLISEWDGNPSYPLSTQVL